MFLCNSGVPEQAHPHRTAAAADASASTACVCRWRGCRDSIRPALQPTSSSPCEHRALACGARANTPSGSCLTGHDARQVPPGQHVNPAATGGTAPSAQQGHAHQQGPTPHSSWCETPTLRPHKGQCVRAAAEREDKPAPSPRLGSDRTRRCFHVACTRQAWSPPCHGMARWRVTAMP